MPRRSIIDRLPNMTNLLVLVGIVVLIASFLAPYWTATRVARAESRALQIASALLELADDKQPDLADETALDELAQALREWMQDKGMPDAWLPQRIEVRAGLDEAPRMIVRVKHYMVQVARTPLDKLPAVEQEEPVDELPENSVPQQVEQPDQWPAERDLTTQPTDENAVEEATPIVQPLPLEVLAWPAGHLGAGYTAFYLCVTGVRAYTRNKSARHIGLARAPWPGSGQPREALIGQPQGPYRSGDDERWIPLPPESDLVRSTGTGSR